jgi:hypothetical protein
MEVCILLINLLERDYTDTLKKNKPKNCKTFANKGMQKGGRDF